MITPFTDRAHRHYSCNADRNTEDTEKTAQTVIMQRNQGLSDSVDKAAYTHHGQVSSEKCATCSFRGKAQ
jgi:hypothetical protein